MKSIATLIILGLFFWTCFKTQKAQTFTNSNEVSSSTYKDGDSLLLIKDTLIFGLSAEGEKVLLYAVKDSKDSVISVTSMGEMGKVEYKFVFNKKLISAIKTTYTYEEPIFMTDSVVIASKEVEEYDSKGNQKDWMRDYYHYYSFFGTYHFKINNKWVGKYTTVLNANDKDPQNDAQIELQISSDTVVYLAKGFQVYQNYILLPVDEGDKLQLYYWQARDFTQSFALDETNDFGIFENKDSEYQWQSPYLQTYFEIQGNEPLVLNKE